MRFDEPLPQYHPGAQIRPGHPEDAGVQVDTKRAREWEREHRIEDDED